MISQFWFHGLRNCFITLTECDLLLPLSLTNGWSTITGPATGFAKLTGFTPKSQ